MIWRKSSYSTPDDKCVEVANLVERIAIRDSKDSSGPALTFSSAEWRRFLSALRAGEFDL